MRALRTILAVGCVLAARPATGAAELPKGKLLERVTCAADATQSYALYVPSNFDASRRWPVVLCFDAGARGALPVARFQAAAEKFGYIVAGSNNSRNGPWAANAAAFNAMLTDLSGSLPLEPERVYVAGLSGGARVACQLAMAGHASGVIACGAGFMGSATPSRVTFPFFGTAGVTDFNLAELRRTDRELEDIRAVHRVVIHPGGHEWLPAEFAVEALAWLDLQAMRRGTKAKDAAWIQAQFEARFAAVPAQPELEILRALTSLAADFKGLRDTAALEQRVAQLTGASAVREALKAERALERREQALGDRLVNLATRRDAARLRPAVAELQSLSTGPAGTPERAMAVRVLQGVWVNGIETTRELWRRDDFAEAVPWLELMVLLRPERAQTYFDLARCRAHGGDKPGALEALRQAAAAGFKDGARVRQEPAFARLHADPAWREVLAAMP